MFSEFMSARRAKLLLLISEATGKALGLAVDEPEPVDDDEEDVDAESDDRVEEAA
jgi:hypothetical protein